MIAAPIHRVGRIEYPFPLAVVAAPRMERVRSCVERLVQSSELFSEPRKLTEAITTFVAYCSPAHCTDADLEISAHWQALFFLIDDQPPAEVLRIARNLWHALNATEPGSGDGSFRIAVQFRELLSARARLSNSQPSNMLHAFHEMLAAMVWEAQVPAGLVLPLAEYHRLRFHTIAVLVHLEVWKFLCGLHVNINLEHRYTLRQLESLATEMMYLVNDLGSFEPDRQRGQQNIILSIGQHHRLELAEAKERVIATHDARLALLVQESAKVQLGGAAGDTRVRDYIDFLGTCLCGNLQSTADLKERYSNWAGEG